MDMWYKGAGWSCSVGWRKLHSRLALSFSPPSSVGRHERTKCVHMCNLLISSQELQWAFSPSLLTREEAFSRWPPSLGVRAGMQGNPDTLVCYWCLYYNHTKHLVKGFVVVVVVVEKINLHRVLAGAESSFLFVTVNWCLPDSGTLLGISVWSPRAS